ncbi:MAG: hypothetical protein PUE30_02015 [Spirochaetia bacterium]|uniref:hypothetical protein n=1 Tax=Treponema berlinense TaxID=225004 RepID=UPI0026F06B61|nr:hypothetical protein [Treponema berlinense]MDD5789293.1 hypothetical protein [Spirochaetia bacterium]
MSIGEIFGLKQKPLQVFAFFGPSGTGKSFRAKLVAQKYHIKAIIDDGLLIYEDNILAGHSAKLEDSYMGAVRVALFDDKKHRDSVALAIQQKQLKKILLLGTSEKMVNKIAMRLQLPLPEKYIRIEDIATPQQIEEARISRQIEGKHVIPVRAYEVKEDGKYSRIFVTKVKVRLSKKKFFRHFFKNEEKKNQLEVNAKLFEKSVVRPAFSVTARKNISQAHLASLAAGAIAVFNSTIRLKSLNIKADKTGYRFFVTIDVPFGEPLTELSKNLKAYVTSSIEKKTGILLEDISIIVDHVLVSAPKTA